MTEKIQVVDLERQPDALLNCTTVANLYGWKPDTLRRKVKQGAVPRPVKQGGRLRWPARVVAADLRQRANQAAFSGTTLAPES